MAKIRVAVLRGGPSSEYDVSLQSGASVLANLPSEKYHPIDVVIDKQGKWHISGIERPIDKVLRQADVVFNALHGAYGEDGQLQSILSLHGIPYTGSKSLASAVAMNKVLTKKRIESVGLKTPVYMVVRKEDGLPHAQAVTIFRTFPQPSVIKPVDSGSSIGVSIAQTIHEIEQALHKAFEHSNTVLIEECISGKEATCGVLEQFRGQDVYALLPIEIIKPDSAVFFDYAAKYGGESQEICPGNFSANESQEIQRMAIAAHKALDLRHYSRSDFMIHPRRGVYFLETNTLPGLTKESLFPKAMKAVGTSFGDFLDHLVQLAVEKR